MEKFKSILRSMGKRLNNTGSVLALIGIIINILIQFGIKVDVEWVNNTAIAICSLLVFFGILNDPTNTTQGYIPGVQDKLIEEEK